MISFCEIGKLNMQEEKPSTEETDRKSSEEVFERLKSKISFGKGQITVFTFFRMIASVRRWDSPSSSFFRGTYSYEEEQEAFRKAKQNQSWRYG